MRKRPRADYDDDHAFLPALTVFEPGEGLRHTIGFVRFWSPPPVAKAKPVKRMKRPAKRK
jgi:hypothetical protein